MRCWKALHIWKSMAVPISPKSPNLVDVERQIWAAIPDQAEPIWSKLFSPPGYLQASHLRRNSRCARLPEFDRGGWGKLQRWGFPAGGSHQAIKMAREHGDLRVEFELYYCLMQAGNPPKKFWVKNRGLFLVALGSLPWIVYQYCLRCLGTPFWLLWYLHSQLQALATTQQGRLWVYFLGLRGICRTSVTSKMIEVIYLQ